MDQKIIDLYDTFTHTSLDRRTFMTRLIQLAGGTTAAYVLLSILENNYANAQIVAPDDPDLQTQRIVYTSNNQDISAYLAHPNGQGPFPAVIVIHENRGLNPHIEDVTRRAAKAGFLALAPDLLSPMGGTPQNEDKARELIGQLDSDATIQNLRAAFEWLEIHTLSNDNIGIVGFCWGGGMANQLAVFEPDLDAAVVFYGRSPDAVLVPDIKAPLMLHYAGLDQRINEGVPDFTAALHDAGKEFEVFFYDGVNHAFHNDTNPARYDEEAANLAWERTITFLKKQLS